MPSMLKITNVARHIRKPLQPPAGQGFLAKSSADMNAKEKKRLATLWTVASAKLKFQSFIPNKATMTVSGSALKGPDKDHSLVLPFYIFPPGSSFHTIWDLCLLVFLGYIAIVTPFRIGFEMDATGFALVFELMIDAFFLFDVVLNFFTAYRLDDGSDELVIDLPSIAKKYISSGFFFIDVFSSIPVDFLSSAITSSSSTGSLDGAKSLKASKVVRMVRMAKFTKLARMTRSFVVVRRLFEDMHLASHFVLTIVRMLAMTLFVAHLNACCWAFISRIGDTFYTNSWVSDWGKGLVDADVGSQYLIALYWSLTIITAGEGGGIAPTNDYEAAYTVLAVVSCGTFYIYVIASLTTLMTSMDMNARLYRERIDAVVAYLKQRKFSKELFTKVFRYYKHFYSSKSLVDESEILTGLSSQLRSDVAAYLSQGIFESTHLFSGCKIEVYTMLLSLLRPLEYCTGDRIFSAGEIGDEFYIIRRGIVWGTLSDFIDRTTENNISRPADGMRCDGPESLQDGKNATQRTLGARATNGYYCLKDGMLFGEFAPLGLIPERIYNASARGRVELYYMRRDDFIAMFEEASMMYMLEHVVDVAGKHLKWFRTYFMLDLFDEPATPSAGKLKFKSLAKMLGKQAVSTMRLKKPGEVRQTRWQKMVDKHKHHQTATLWFGDLKTKNESEGSLQNNVLRQMEKQEGVFIDQVQLMKSQLMDAIQAMNEKSERRHKDIVKRIAVVEKAVHKMGLC